MRPRTVLASISGLFGLVLLVLATGSPAAADDGPVLVADTDSVTLTDTAGGGATASITLQNQGPRDIGVSVAPGPGAADGCDITVPGDATLNGHRQQKITLIFSEACAPDRARGTEFEVTAGDTTFELHANPPASPKPNWWMVALAYIGAAIGSGVVLLVAWNKWVAPESRSHAKSLNMSLPSLGASWKFADSWAANATVLTALFTGLFGAKEVTTALLGDDATDVLAITLVSAAVSVGLVALSPMLLQASKAKFATEQAPKDPDGKPLTDDIEAAYYITPRAVLLAAFCTLTATAGQLATILYAVAATDFGDDWVFIVTGVLAAVALIWYAWAATDQNLTAGATMPPAEEPQPPTTTLVPLPQAAGTRLEAASRPEEQLVAVVLPAAPRVPRRAGGSAII